MSEIDALRELSELKASLSYEFWDNAAYVALVAVFIGVIGEFLVELAIWPRDAVRRAKLGKASALILIAGLGGDIVTYAKKAQLTAQSLVFCIRKQVTHTNLQLRLTSAQKLLRKETWNRRNV